MRYWVSPNGKAIEVAEHALYVYDHPKVFGITKKDVEEAVRYYGDGGDWLIDGGFFDHIIYAGWIRIWGVGKELSFTVKEKNNRTIDRIMMFLVSHKEEASPFNRITIAALESSSSTIFGTVEEIISGEVSLYESKFGRVVEAAKLIDKKRMWSNWLGFYVRHVYSDGIEKRVYDSGVTQYYDNNDKLHRDSGPAVIKKGYEGWYNHGKLHRIGGPAESEYGVSGVTHVYWNYGKLHNIAGPAVIRLFKTNRELNNVEYWVNNRRMTKEEFEKHFGK